MGCRQLRACGLSWGWLRSRVSVGALAVSSLLLAHSLVAQNPPISTPPGTPTQQQEAPKKKKELPAEEQITMETRDKVLLRATWLGSNLEKEAVPVILLPGWGQTREKLLPLAAVLQRDYGCAVIIPDWRGHGDSNTVVGVNERLNRDRFGKNELAAMTEDIESCKRFLRDKNNAGELNLDMLVVIANHELASVAAAWCITDWSWPLLGGKKQGQFVKILVMISPTRKFKTTSLGELAKHPLLQGSSATGLTTVLMYGTQDTNSMREAEALESTLAKPRSANRVSGKPDAASTKVDLFTLRYASGKVGEALIDDRWDLIPQDLGKLIKLKLQDRAADFPWIEYTR